MPVISTKRLQLLALTAGQLRLYLVDPGRLEEALNLQPGLAPAGQALRRAIGLKLQDMAGLDERLLAWHTYWLVIVSERQTGAGLVGFKGSPDENGQVELGYGIEPSDRSRGYATEAVGALVEWAYASPECLAVTARTQATNEVSMAVLRKVGFQPNGSENGQLLWRLKKGTHDV